MDGEELARLHEIRGRLLAITPGDWRHDLIIETDGHFHFVVTGDRTVIGSTDENADAEFMAHAPDDIAFLIDLLNRD